MHKDHLGNVFTEKRYERIISIVPSQTELLFDLSLADRVVGITKFCIHPNEWFENKNRVGGTKNVSLQKVAELKPDLIIGNKEENTKDDIEALMQIAPVWISDIFSVEDSLDMITRLGRLLNVAEKANFLAHQIDQNFSGLNKLGVEKSCIYLIWRDPFMAVANDTFIHNILSEQMGLRNIMMHERRYPVVDLNHLKETPDFVFLSSEPYPFGEKHIEEIQDALPKSKVVLVDGEYFSWYGSRLAISPSYLNRLLKDILVDG
jgi:ABC-type Fe3+-hydroxamate transport system substrate-binding protein